MTTSAKESLSMKALFGACIAVLTTLLLVPVSTWQYLVNRLVNEPYLDEVFHVRQAQVYCAGQLQTWDPKITTPPGLYFINYALRYLGAPCSISTLRLTNALFLVAGVFPIAFICRSSWAMSLSKAAWRQFDLSQAQRLVADAHTALNIALFPPLFFFSGLYYTDVASTAFVLATWMLIKLRTTYCHDSAEEFLKTVHVIVAVVLLIQGQWLFAAVSSTTAFLTAWPLRPSDVNDDDSSEAPVRSDLQMMRYIGLVGLASLTFRQTNIFWVAVFPAALTLLDGVRGTRARSTSITALLNDSAFSRTFYNPLLADASLEDIIESFASMIACLGGTVTFILSHPFSVQSQSIVGKILPYASLLGLFVIFVAVNGGIVLGDKSNHVATIHLPQMLYIWPYMAFFSAPIIAPVLIGSILPANLLPEMISQYASKPRISLMAMGAAISAGLTAVAVIHVNTIVHPFTLADNRHYVFYIFRILRLNPVLYYLAVPIYLLCGYLVVQALGIPLQSKGTKMNEAEPKARGARINFLIVWTVTTALCLIGAPLVEPRYFVLPWVMWRLEVPCPSNTTLKSSSWAQGGTALASQGRSTGAAPTASATKTDEKDEKQSASASFETMTKLQILQALLGDYRLWLETGWHLAINLITGYIFLYKDFEWAQEPGKAQRFLW